MLTSEILRKYSDKLQYLKHLDLSSHPTGIMVPAVILSTIESLCLADSVIDPQTLLVCNSAKPDS